MGKTFDYIKGFHDGYILRRNHVVLVKRLINSFKGETEYLKGLKAGVIRHEHELDPKLEAFRERRQRNDRRDKDRPKDQGLQMGLRGFGASPSFVRSGFPRKAVPQSTGLPTGRGRVLSSSNP